MRFDMHDLLILSRLAFYLTMTGYFGLILWRTLM